MGGHDEARCSDAERSTRAGAFLLCFVVEIAVESRRILWLTQ